MKLDSKIVGNWKLYGTNRDLLHTNLKKIRHTLSNVPLKITQYSNINTWMKAAKNYGKPELNCQSNQFCTAENLCYWQDTSDRSILKLFTVGEKKFDWSPSKPEATEWLKDYHGPAGRVIPIQIEKYKIWRLENQTYLFTLANTHSLFHFAQVFLPFFEFISSHKNMPLEHLLFLMNHELGAWQRGLIDIARKMNLVSEVHRLSTEKRQYPNTLPVDWNEVNFIEPEVPIPKLDGHTIVCLDKAIFPHLGPEREWPLYTDAALIKKFRETAYKMMGVDIAPKPSPHITILKRTTNRKFFEEREMIYNLTELVEPYGFTVKYIDLEPLTWREQFEIISKTGLLIGMHGSGLTNLLFLHPDATVLEIFPFKTQRYLAKHFSYPARKIGVNYLNWSPSDISGIVFPDREWPELRMRECNGYSTEDEDDPEQDLSPDCVKFYSNEGLTKMEVYTGSSAYFEIRYGLSHLYQKIHGKEKEEFQ
jgi:hypothetical protein